MNQLILTIENRLILDAELSGGKGANSARLTRAGFNVPSFFILSTSLYTHIININGIDRFINKAVIARSLENFKQVQFAILDAKIPDPILQQIISAWKNLIQNSYFKKVAVRSSALAEDLQEQSYAGQLESHLDIRDEEQLLESIKKCWASLWNERIYAYQSRDQTQLTPQPMAVIVQQMIPVTISGICFTIDPTDDTKEFMMIEAHGGSGAEIVGGKVNPVNYRIDRKSLEISSENHTEKQPELLSKEQLSELARTCLKIEVAFSTPQDIEWGFFQDKFYIFQSRPITTTAKQQILTEKKLWSNYFFGERFLQPVSPLGWSILKPLIETNAFREPLKFLGFYQLSRSRITKCFNGRPYTKLEVFRALHSLFPTRFVSSEKRSLFYKEPVLLRESLVRIFKRIIPILKSLFSTTEWIPPIHLRNWKRFLNYYEQQISKIRTISGDKCDDIELWEINSRAEYLSDQLLSLHRWSITFAELIFHFLIHLIRKWLPQMNAEKTVIEIHRGLPGNKTVEMNIELWNLSRSDRFHPPHGGWNRYFTATTEWKLFEQKYGHRSTSLDIAVPTFADEINYILELIQQYRAVQPEISPEMKQKKFEKQREECLQIICQNLAKQHLGFFNKRFFRLLINWSGQFILLRENQRYYWHQALTINRKIFKKLGKRFFDRGWLEQPEHIFFLTRDEIEKVILSNTVISKSKIEQRLKQHQQWQKIQPPALIDESALLQGESQIIGEKLVGIGVSPGIASGKARVLTGLQEMFRIQPGEILVVLTTDPGWTPLFGIIKGLVMEVGGVLSHGSIVAREFGIPAVTSVWSATTQIKTGMKITIDGYKGVIWIDEDLR